MFPIDGRLVLNPERQLHARRDCAARRRRRAQSAWNRRRVRPPATRPLFERLLCLRSSEGLVLFLSRLGSCECLLSERRVRTDASLEVAASAFVCSAGGHCDRCDWHVPIVRVRVDICANACTYIARRLYERALLGEAGAGQLAAQRDRRLELRLQSAGGGPPELKLRERQMYAHGLSISVSG